MFMRKADKCKVENHVKEILRRQKYFFMYVKFTSITNYNKVFDI